ncbi:hypothetical protein STVA_44300 [Allostella vacuolata]|nr:hypothetical protein STVA_44300 [Stella vacuolata]
MKRLVAILALAASPFAAPAASAYKLCIHTSTINIMDRNTIVRVGSTDHTLNYMSRPCDDNAVAAGAVSAGFNLSRLADCQVTIEPGRTEQITIYVNQNTGLGSTVTYCGTGL